MKQKCYILVLLAIAFILGISFENASHPTMAAKMTEPEPVIDTLTDWDCLQLAIAMTESRFNPNAVGKSSDYGIFQITPIYVREVNRLSGGVYILEDAFSIEKSIEMFAIVQGVHNPECSVERAISLHNPGASSAYAKTIKNNIIFIQRYEAVRAALIEYERMQ